MVDGLFALPGAHDPGCDPYVNAGPGVIEAGTRAGMSQVDGTPTDIRAHETPPATSC